MPNRTKLKLSYALVLACAVVHTALPAHGDTYTWQGGGGDNNWSTAGNWVDNVAPTSDLADTNLIFGPSAFPWFPFADSALSLHSLDFTSNAADYAIDGAGLTLGAGGITQDSAKVQSINNAVTLGAEQDWNFGDGATLSLTGGVNTNGHTLTARGLGAYTLAGAISGSGALNKIGSGTLTLTGASAYTGSTTVNAGGLTVGSGGSLINSPINVNGGTSFHINGGSVHTGSANFRLGISASGTAATATLSSGALSSNTTAVGYVASSTAGFTQTGGSHSVNQLYLAFDSGATGTYALSNTGTLSTFFTIIGNNGTGAFTQTGGTHTAHTLYLGSASSSSGTYTLGDTGNLSTGNTYVGNLGTGVFTQTGGTHTVSSGLFMASEPGSSSTYTLSNSGTLSAFSSVVGYYGTGTFTQTGGMHTVVDCYLGLISDSSGTYVLSDSGKLTISGNLTVGNMGTGTLTITGGEVVVGGSLLANASSQVLLDGGKLSVNQFGAGGLDALNWQSGTLGLSDVNGLTIGPSGLFGATLLLDENRTLEVDHALTIENAATLFAGGGLKAGSAIVTTGAQLFVNAGLTAGSADIATGGLALLGGTTQQFGSGLTNHGHVVLTDSTTVDGVVTNAGAITALEDVTFNDMVNGAGGFFGPGEVTFAGGFSPGASAAEVSFESSLTLDNANTLFIKIGGTMAGSEHDALSVAGSVTLDGILDVSFLGEFTPAAGDSFDILNWGSLSDTFDTLSLPTLGAGLMWNASQLYTAGALNVAITGDYNLNGAVDAADYTVWRNTLGMMGDGLAADGNRNGEIDADDYALWKLRYGDAAVGAASIAAESEDTAVPEPASLALAIAALVGTLLIHPLPRPGLRRSWQSLRRAEYA